jgi:fatty acid desaturase
VRPIGEAKVAAIDTHLLSATHENLSARPADGRVPRGSSPMTAEARIKTWLDSQPRAALVDRAGRSYTEFRSGLRTRWWRVWIEIGAAYLAFGLTAGAAHWATGTYPDAWLASVPAAAVMFGYWMAYLQLFIHEAAHYNIAPSRIWNDRMANALIACWVATDISKYREIHWEHHRRHGEPGDTEHSYFSALDGRFMLEILFGVRALRVLATRERAVAARQQENARRGGGANTLVATALLHTGVVAALWFEGSWPLALSWVLGIGMFLPFFGALRQLLEHRGSDARKDVNYHEVAHGRTTRMFREGPFASTFGGAGFTRHALHHWDPQVSYTNLAELETFLADCRGESSLGEYKTTYAATALMLFGR